eukprot:CAMPEP_0197028042 /NCGR_PEP_ID=MMETSP1384-20130603/7846_1 /TAXON_ID=29189 /ORGANISM="Ammonia sp." /LENGTH=455 /DNA_ID=CAMNT_0042456983 /DNA_START=32 /DNA_END=1399 /DNA_ORIENTATION=-
MNSTAKSKLMRMYNKSKSDNKTSSKKKKKQKHNKQKPAMAENEQHGNALQLSKSITASSTLSSNRALSEYLHEAHQAECRLLSLPLQILEHILYEFFYPFQLYRFCGCCKLLRYFIDDALQSTLNDSLNDHRIHNFKYNATYFYQHLHRFVFNIKKSTILDVSNETLRTFNTEQRQFACYLFMYQSKLATMYTKETNSSKFKRLKQKQTAELEQRRRHKHEEDNANESENESTAASSEIKPQCQILVEFADMLSACNKAICGGNAIWFHVNGLKFVCPLLYSKYCQISSLSLDRDYINDEILLSFCKSLLLRNALYAEQSPLYDCSFLKRLDFSHNAQITDIGLNTLFAVLGEKCPNLQEIYLSNLAITNLSCKILYRFYQLFGDRTRLKIIVLNRNKFIDEQGVDVLNDLFKHGIIGPADNVRFFVAQCRISSQQLLYHNSWDHRIKLEMPERI